MISAFILYYLNLKPTHGYEIQKMLQVSGIEKWAKIQSGSIYYALTKLEKEKYIQVLREERTGSRVRKIYEITESGRKEMEDEMAQQLDTVISSVGSMKFCTEPILSVLSKEKIIKIVTGHIAKLQEQKEFWEKWYQIKVDDKASQLSRLTFEMTIDSLSYQIRWHQELLEHLDDYILAGRDAEQMIKSIDFEQIADNTGLSEEEQKLQYAMKIKEEILRDPQNAVGNLDRIIEEIRGQIKNK